MSIGERACNWLMGLSVLGWAVRAILSEVAEIRWTTVPLVVCAINGLVGVLFLTRAPLRIEASPWALAGAIPSFMLGALALKLVPPATWPVHSQVLFAAGGAFTFASLAFLGRSFAILPGVRKVVVRGPYRLIRHPAYAGECVMLGAACSANVTSVTVAVALAAVACLVVRILAEEATLLTDADYQAYSKEHRWRLIPLVW